MMFAVNSLVKRGDLMQHIFNKLELENATNLYSYTRYCDNVLLPLRINKSLHAMNISPHSILIFENKPIILFFNQEDDTENIFKQCWNFAESPIIIIEDQFDFNVYNGYDYILENGNFLLPLLTKEKLNYISIMNGEYINSFEDINNKDKHLNKKLLGNIKYARENLLKNSLSKEISNSLIGRIIFIRYLIDRKINLNFNNQKKALTNDELKVILSDKQETYKLFEYLKSNDGFNGDWFPIIEDYENNIFEKDLVLETHLNILIHLISGTEIKTGQQSLFDIYDFSIIPIEFISNIYESFIGEEEQSKNGAYYTPTFLVDYILKYTIDDYFKNNPKEYNCKILDPACGSGVFLVETLRKLINQFKNVTGNSPSSNQIKKLVTDNIYGLDKDKNAILISVFSLYLTMLDYQDPKDIEEFLFPYLLKSEKNTNPNFFNDDFFDTDAPFNNILLNKKLNYIIGNPPYGRGTINEGSLADKYIKQNKISIGNQDLVQAFMVRVKDLSREDTKISFIVTSKVLYNLQSKEFRTNHFFNKFKINHVLELSSVMSDIFENADVPVSILFYEPSNIKEIVENSIHYISMKPNPYFDKLKILLLSKIDYKRILQKKLIENDYLWKILVYGSYLDFNFIKRLKEYSTINSHINSTHIGVTIGNRKNSMPQEYIGMPYVQTKQFKQFLIESNSLKWEESYAERTRTLDVFKAPSLLISKGISKNLDFKMGILKEDSIFSGTITAVKCSSQDTLYGIMGFLNSSFFRYFTMHTASSIGIERPQIHNPEKFSLPYKKNNKVINITKNIEKYIKENFLTDDRALDDLKDTLNKQVLNTFNLSEQEHILVDYTDNILIPWIMHKQYDSAFKKLAYQSEEIENYVDIFIQHYSAIYKQNNMFFAAEIIYANYAIGIKFKVLESKPNILVSWTQEKSLENLIKLSGNKSIENLFIQKDIKGFEEDYFYIVKPNEYKNWHKAVGYLDFYEFQDALLRSEV